MVDAALTAAGTVVDAGALQIGSPPGAQPGMAHPLVSSKDAHNPRERLSFPELLLPHCCELRFAVMICPRGYLRIVDSMLFLNSYSGTESGGSEQAWRESCGDAAPRRFEQGCSPVPWLRGLQGTWTCHYLTEKLYLSLLNTWLLSLECCMF